MMYGAITIGLLLVILGVTIIRSKRLEKTFKLMNCDCDGRGCHKCLK